MTQLDRRAFLVQSTAACAAASLGVLHASAAEQGQRKFTMDLVCGAIGVRADQPAAIELAHRYGFESVQPSAGYLKELSDGDLQSLLDDLKIKDLVWGAAGLSVDFRKDDTVFQNGMKQLPGHARAIQRAGATRMSTWLSPSHQQLTYLANFRQHAQRLRKVATVLGDHGLRFGLEYVGPKKSWTAKRFPFVHTMLEARELIAEIDRDNVGLVLDSWHWYTAGETVEDLLGLSSADVVACDLNDAPAGLAVEDQVDSSRELPAGTGVIDLKGFLNALVQIGYDGPVRAEPFNRTLNAMDNEDAVRATAAAMHKAFALLS